MREYQRTFIEIVTFSNEDVVATSGASTGVIEDGVREDVLDDPFTVL